MKLYDMQMAPNPRRVRVFLAEKGIDNVEPDLGSRRDRRVVKCLVHK